MSGQSITDRITAAQHSVTGSAISKTVCKATTHEIMGPKKKHLDCEYAVCWLLMYVCVRLCLLLVNVGLNAVSVALRPAHTCNGNVHLATVTVVVRCYKQCTSLYRQSIHRDGPLCLS